MLFFKNPLRSRTIVESKKERVETDFQEKFVRATDNYQEIDNMLLCC